MVCGTLSEPLIVTDLFDSPDLGLANLEVLVYHHKTQLKIPIGLRYKRAMQRCCHEILQPGQQKKYACIEGRRNDETHSFLARTKKIKTNMPILREARSSEILITFLALIQYSYYKIIMKNFILNFIYHAV